MFLSCKGKLAGLINEFFIFIILKYDILVVLFRFFNLFVEFSQIFRALSVFSRVILKGKKGKKMKDRRVVHLVDPIAEGDTKTGGFGCIAAKQQSFSEG